MRTGYSIDRPDMDMMICTEQEGAARFSNCHVFPELPQLLGLISAQHLGRKFTAPNRLREV
jgi:hypothetical protein